MRYFNESTKFVYIHENKESELKAILSNKGIEVERVYLAKEYASNDCYTAKIESLTPRAALELQTSEKFNLAQKEWVAYVTIKI